MNSIFTAIIVDDERPARLMLSSLLEKHKNTINIIGQASNGKEAIKLIEECKPDIVFLDIQMPDMSGFEVLTNISNNPVIIFVTAFDQYAINAFAENSIDYLLKPVEEERLEKSIQKLLSLRKSQKVIDLKSIQEVFNQLQPKKDITALPIKIGQKIILIRLAETAYFKSSDGYTSLYTSAGKEHITDLSLQELEEKLPDNFIRVQKSYIVNKNNIKEIQRYFNNRLILFLDDINNTKITTGTNYITQIRKELGLY